MVPSARQPWLRSAVLIGAVYSLVGAVSAALAGPAVSPQTRTIWRLAAWVVSAFVFGAHIAYEHFRRRHPPRSTALHAAAAAAVGGFGLAVAAVIHSLSTTSGNLPLLIVALVVWPVLVFGPAFLVALAASALLGGVLPPS